ncbi:unnamed protein product [Darwinula stevensoni]|uniref:Uncharacterized protein n=1 Tax=Darwinula stevensoni TaxID=69355 RepID=A0A7R8X789_9CRUS|nr:unnamed protein product [Darwinula stevensoni]CAG0880250.1 unnamed protein product [Darwinula stevensoni]
MRNNWVVKDLRERIFGNMTFDEIHIWNTNLVALDPSAVLSSKDRLESLTISHSLLEEFPFRVLPRMTRLRTLHLSHGFLKSVPALESPSLKNLLLWNNEIHALEPRWSMPVLERLDISHNPISDLPPGMVEGMRNLMSFDASHCNLGPVLRNGSLAFQSKSLAKIFLQENDIVKLEPGAITGLRNDTRLDLRGNKIRNLTEGSFRPMLEHLSSGTSGFIFLWGNPVICDEWLVRSPDFKKFLQRLEGVECVSKSSKSPAK